MKGKFEKCSYRVEAKEKATVFEKFHSEGLNFRKKLLIEIGKLLKEFLKESTS